MSQITLSRQQWQQAFSQLGWASPIPEKIWQLVGGKEEQTSIALDWPKVYSAIHQIGWSDRHAEALWKALQPTDPKPSREPKGETAKEAKPKSVKASQSTQVTVEAADWKQRAAAGLIDVLLCGIPFCLVLFLGTLLLGGGLQKTYDPATHQNQFDLSGSLALALPVLLLAWLVPLAYNYFGMNRTGDHQGQTLGKQLMGIKTVRADGSPITQAHVVMRIYVAQGIGWMTGSLLMMVALGNLGYGLAALYTILWWIVCPLLERHGRAPHDLIAKTQTIPA